MMPLTITGKLPCIEYQLISNGEMVEQMLGYDMTMNPGQPQVTHFTCRRVSPRPFETPAQRVLPVKHYMGSWAPFARLLSRPQLRE